MTIYHLTRAENAAKILSEGFVDTTNGEGKTGAWFSVPASASLEHDNVHADTVVSIEVPDDVLKEFEREYYPPSLPKELADDLIRKANFRELCIPAAKVNQYRNSLQQMPLAERRTGQ